MLRRGRPTSSGDRLARHGFVEPTSPRLALAIGGFLGLLLALGQGPEDAVAAGSLSAARSRLPRGCARRGCGLPPDDPSHDRGDEPGS